MDHFLEYGKTLVELRNQGIIFVCIICIIAIICLALLLKFKMSKMWIIGGIIVSILVLILAFTVLILPYQTDINEKSIISYSGSFCIEEIDYGKYTYYVFIKCKGQPSVRYQLYYFGEMKTGEYEGEFIYSLNSRCLLDFNASPILDKKP
ncbi:MAG: hypothetical protein IJC17_06240 [Clostridia bacterium]|nr:hypothetical protein [Clostridia bacterium]